MVGLLVSLGAFVGYVEERGEVAAADLIARFEALTAEVGRRYGMTPVKAGGGILLLGQTREAVLGAAHALADEFEPDGYLPVHVSGQPGDVVRLEDGQRVELAARIRLTGHPGEVQPVKRS